MQGPVIHVRSLIKLGLRFREAVERRCLAEGREVAGVFGRYRCEQTLCGAPERHDVLASVLGDVTRDGERVLADHSARKSGDLAAPLSGENEELHDTSKRV